MIVPAFSQGLYGRLRQLAAADWQRYVAHPFVQQLADGTLAENAFRRYLTQDYLFLIHFARSYALLVSKLRALPEMRAAAASMNAILNELPLHVGYCAQWGISEPEMAAQPEAPETLNYTRYVLDIGHSGDALDLLVALMPCVAGYAEIGLGLLQHPATRLDDNPYASWIRNYGDEGYLQGVSAALALLETVWQQRGSEARITELSEIFTTATRGEVVASDGQPIQGRLAWMGQKDLLYPWLSVRDNVALGARLRGEKVDRDRVAALLEQVELSSCADARPATLSGGMRQRAALARTLYEDRPIVLMDEPFSALDTLTRTRIQTLAATLLAGRTVVLITHDPQEACRLSHRLLVLSAADGDIDDSHHLAGTPPRAPDAPDLLIGQAALLQQLMRAQP